MSDAIPGDRLFWLVVVSGLALVGLLWGLRDTRRVVEAPFLYAVGMTVLMLPQYYIAAAQWWRVPDEAYWVYSIMVLISSIAFYVGYFTQPRKIRGRRQRVRWKINDDRLFKFGLIVGAIGSFGSIKLWQMGEVEVWRGWAVYWVTLSKLSVAAVFMVMISYAQSRRPARLLAALMLSVFPLIAVLEAGRRSMTILLPLMYIVPLYLYNPRWRVPRWSIITAGVLLFIVVYAFPYWRQHFATDGIVSSIQGRPLTSILTEMFSKEEHKTFETIDSMIMTGAYYHVGNYRWGFFTVYNLLVELYIPGGLIGRDLKESLFIGQGLGVEWIRDVYNIDVAYYTGKSAYAELFSEFSFFGALLFFAVGRVYRRARDSVVQDQDGRAIIFTCLFIAIPATLPWSQFLYGLATQLPVFAVMFLAWRRCVQKEVVASSHELGDRSHARLNGRYPAAMPLPQKPYGSPTPPMRKFSS